MAAAWKPWDAVETPDREFGRRRLVDPSLRISVSSTPIQQSLSIIPSPASPTKSVLGTILDSPSFLAASTEQSPMSPDSPELPRPRRSSPPPRDPSRANRTQSKPGEFRLSDFGNRKADFFESDSSDVEEHSESQPSRVAPPNRNMSMPANGKRYSNYADTWEFPTAERYRQSSANKDDPSTSQLDETRLDEFLRKSAEQDAPKHAPEADYNAVPKFTSPFSEDQPGHVRDNSDSAASNRNSSPGGRLGPQPAREGILLRRVTSPKRHSPTKFLDASLQRHDVVDHKEVSYILNACATTLQSLTREPRVLDSIALKQQVKDSIAWEAPNYSSNPISLPGTTSDSAPDRPRGSILKPSIAFKESADPEPPAVTSKRSTSLPRTPYKPKKVSLVPPHINPTPQASADSPKVSTPYPFLGRSPSVFSQQMAAGLNTNGLNSHPVRRASTAASRDTHVNHYLVLQVRRRQAPSGRLVDEMLIPAESHSNITPTSATFTNTSRPVQSIPSKPGQETSITTISPSSTTIPSVTTEKRFDSLDFDDAAFFFALRERYYGPSGCLLGQTRLSRFFRRYFSLRKLQYIAMVSADHDDLAPDVQSAERRTRARNTVALPPSDTFSDRNLFSHFRDPARGKARYSWVYWVHRIATLEETMNTSTNTDPTFHFTFTSQDEDRHPYKIRNQDAEKQTSNDANEDSTTDCDKDKPAQPSSNFSTSSEEESSTRTGRQGRRGGGEDWRPKSSRKKSRSQSQSQSKPLDPLPKLASRRGSNALVDSNTAAPTTLTTLQDRRRRRSSTSNSTGTGTGTLSSLSNASLTLEFVEGWSWQRILTAAIVVVVAAAAAVVRWVCLGPDWAAYRWLAQNQNRGQNDGSSGGSGSVGDVVVLGVERGGNVRRVEGGVLLGIFVLAVGWMWVGVLGLVSWLVM